MRWIPLWGLLLTLLPGGCCSGGHTPEDEQRQLQAQYDEIATELAAIVDETRYAVNVGDWAEVDELANQQEELFRGLIEIEEQLAALGASPDTDVGSLTGLASPPPVPSGENDTPEGQARVDSLWVVISMFEEAIKDAVEEQDQERIQELEQERWSYMQELADLLGKPASG